MHALRCVVSGAAAAVLLASMSARSQDKVDVEALKQYGGTYSSDCDHPAAPRVVATIDALHVEQDQKRITGRYLQAANSYFGQSPPPNYQVVLMSEVRTGLDLLFIVYRDPSGLYITLDGHPHVRAALGESLLGRKFRRCDAATAKSTATAGRALPMAPQIGPSEMLKDPKFGAAYYKALGP